VKEIRTSSRPDRAADPERTPTHSSMRAFAVTAALFLCAGSAAAQAPVAYEVSFPNAIHHEAEFSVTYRELPQRPLELRMSRSSPGRYALHEFAKNVYNVRAFDSAGRPLSIARPNLHQWDVTGHDGTVRVTYTLFGNQSDGTYAQIDDGHVHFNAPAAFMWARGTETRPVTVRFSRPRADWKIATQLFPGGAADTYTAPDLRYLLDSPVEISDHEVRSWEMVSNGKPYTMQVAVHHLGRSEDLDAYVEMMKRAADEAVALFGELPDFDTGAFLFMADHLPANREDGMEHRNSTVVTSDIQFPDATLGAVWLSTHELLHAWNSVRIRPRSLEPFDFEEANISGELWFLEGFTSYYDDLILLRAGHIDADQFLNDLGGELSGVVNAPGRRIFTPVELSQRVPFADGAMWMDPYNRQNTHVTHYDLGSAIALGLDLTLRTRFPGRSLDDYMRAMWIAHGKREIPYTLADLKNVLAQVTGDRAFAEDYFGRYVEGFDLVDYERLLAPAGVLLRRAAPDRPFLGMVIDNGTATISQPPQAGSSVYAAGLTLGDRIVSMDGVAITGMADVRNAAGARKPGDTVVVAFERRGELREARVALLPNPQMEIVTYEAAGMPVTDAMRAFRAAWFGSRVRGEAR